MPSTWQVVNFIPAAKGRHEPRQDLAFGIHLLVGPSNVRSGPDPLAPRVLGFVFAHK
jgi:hypothetical protein